MKRHILLFASVIFLFFASCNNSSFDVLEDGVTVRLKPSDAQNTRLVRIQVLSDDIFRVRISLRTGIISFYNKENQLLLKEDANGRSFSEISVDGTHGYTMRQVFDSPDEEGLYGLGQHQSEEFNYKGKNEELYQYNSRDM